MPSKTQPKLVRYVSPFGSPASMSPDEAERHLAKDLVRWEEWLALDLLDEHALRIGVPRIGDDTFRLSELPEWQTPGKDPFELIRALVRQAEQRKRDHGEKYVVVEREGRYAVFPARLLIDGDDVRWATP